MQISHAISLHISKKSRTFVHFFTKIHINNSIKLKQLNQMKKIAIFCVMASMALFACKPSPEQPSKVADYLFEITVNDYRQDAPNEVTGAATREFGCSAVRNGNFYGRNLDFFISEASEFIVHTTATETRHATLGVARLFQMTDEEIAAGLTKEQIDLIPWGTLDGINDAGLICNMNVVPAEDAGIPHTSPNPGMPDINCIFLVRALLDNCATVEEAKEFVASHNIIGVNMGGWDLHFMIADPENTVVLEFIDNKAVYTETNIMTNFYVGAAEYTPNADGIERYDILTANYAEAETMEGMWNLLRRVRFSQAYDPEVVPFWRSEFLAGPYDITTPEEVILADEKVQADIENFRLFKETGAYTPDMHLWFTVHNSTYDIENKTLWVTIREDYERRYEFKL